MNKYLFDGELRCGEDSWDKWEKVYQSIETWKQYSIAKAEEINCLADLRERIYSLIK